ncbi:MAG: ATP-binding protein [Kiritimatiellae bacterium]|nr:ATP-binding protein [Kiritimatiellia bacterium]
MSAMKEMTVSGMGGPVPVRRVAPMAPMAPAAARRNVQFGKVAATGGHRVVLYGPGGIGKTTLAAQLPGPVAFIDLDESLPRLHAQFDAAGLSGNILPVSGVADWQTLRDALQADGWDSVKSIVIDTATKAEEMAVAFTLANTLMEGGKKAGSVEGYGYGKGYGHVFDTFLPLLADLDRHCRAGRNVVLICHDCTANVPNPAGEDWLRYEPRLQSPTSGKASIRLRVREWADHVLFIGYDVDVGKDGKGRGAGTRTLYTSELPHCMAKSRSTQEVIPVEGDGAAVWGAVIR